jgi:hypothetical protein
MSTPAHQPPPQQQTTPAAQPQAVPQQQQAPTGIMQGLPQQGAPGAGANDEPQGEVRDETQEEGGEPEHPFKDTTVGDINSVIALAKSMPEESRKAIVGAVHKMIVDAKEAFGRKSIAEAELLEVKKKLKLLEETQSEDLVSSINNLGDWTAKHVKGARPVLSPKDIEAMRTLPTSAQQALTMVFKTARAAGDYVDNSKHQAETKAFMDKIRTSRVEDNYEENIRSLLRGGTTGIPKRFLEPTQKQQSSSDYDLPRKKQKHIDAELAVQGLNKMYSQLQETDENAIMAAIMKKGSVHN